MIGRRQTCLETNWQMSLLELFESSVLCHHSVFRRTEELVVDRTVAVRRWRTMHNAPPRPMMMARTWNSPSELHTRRAPGNKTAQVRATRRRPGEPGRLRPSGHHRTGAGWSRSGVLHAPRIATRRRAWTSTPRSKSARKPRHHTSFLWSTCLASIANTSATRSSPRDHVALTGSLKSLALAIAGTLHRVVRYAWILARHRRPAAAVSCCTDRTGRARGRRDERGDPILPCCKNY